MFTMQFVRRANGLNRFGKLKSGFNSRHLAYRSHNFRAQNYWLSDAKDGAYRTISGGRGSGFQPLSVRFSSAATYKRPIRILYGSQGGTAKIFAMQLAGAIGDLNPDRDVSISGLHEAPTPLEALHTDSVHVFFVSVAGVGEPPDNARSFYDWLMNKSTESGLNWPAIDYTVFALGNQKAHPNHYNVIGKDIDTRLHELGASRIHSLGLGDDGECIEDDFDVWMEKFVTSITEPSAEADGGLSNNALDASIHEDDEQVDFAEVVLKSEDHDLQNCPGALDSSGKRLLSSKYPMLKLQLSETDVVKEDLFHLNSSSRAFYSEDVQKLSIVDNRILSVHSEEYGLRELRISLEADANISYEAGDHMIIYPRNSNCVVEAYLKLLDVDPNCIVDEDPSGTRPYPHPTGITLKETLSHCVDLGAIPSPSLSRLLLGKKDIDYKNDIANPRRTVLDLACESGRKLSMEEILYNLPTMKPRYYSIASSPLVHPTEAILTYRPVKYVTSRGCLREGVCTSYLNTLGVGEATQSSVAAAVKSNPTFRLPKDLSAPLLLIAGGCGIAPIRAFLEERLCCDTSQFGNSHLFLGFRSPSDEVYRSLVDRALATGAITDVQVSYSSSCITSEQNCRLVSDTVRANGRALWDLFESGGYAYLCGGARTFGAAIEREVLGVIQEQGGMTLEQATHYLQRLIAEGRFCEDLAD